MYQIACTSKGRDPDQLVGSVIATSMTGQKLVVADARLVGECAALRFLKLASHAPPDLPAATMSVLAILAVINCDGVPFIPGGPEYQDERRVAESIGFRHQTATTQLRAQLFGYKLAPAGALVLDITGPIELAELVLAMVKTGFVDVPILRASWMPDYLASLARQGVPVQDRPPGSRWLQ